MSEKNRFYYGDSVIQIGSNGEVMYGDSYENFNGYLTWLGDRVYSYYHNQDDGENIPYGYIKFEDGGAEFISTELALRAMKDNSLIKYRPKIGDLYIQAPGYGSVITTFSPRADSTTGNWRDVNSPQRKNIMDSMKASGFYTSPFASRFGGTATKLAPYKLNVFGSAYGNCTAYAFSRYLEIGAEAGAVFDLSKSFGTVGKDAQGRIFLPTGNACEWWTNANSYYKGKEPKEGSIFVTDATPTNSAGHVQIVEKVVNNSDGTKTFYTTESAYGGLKGQSGNKGDPYIASRFYGDTFTYRKDGSIYKQSGSKGVVSNALGFIYNKYLMDASIGQYSMSEAPAATGYLLTNFETVDNGTSYHFQAVEGNANGAGSVLQVKKLILTPNTLFTEPVRSHGLGSYSKEFGGIIGFIRPVYGVGVNRNLTPSIAFGNANIAEVTANNSYLDRGSNAQLRNANYIKNYLGAKGWSIEAISAVVGSMEKESTLNPGLFERLPKKVPNAGTNLTDTQIREHLQKFRGGIVNYKCQPGFGLMQWSPAELVMNWQVSHGYNLTNIAGQLDLIHEEIANSYKHPNPSPPNSGGGVQYWHSSRYDPNGDYNITGRDFVTFSGGDNVILKHAAIRKLAGALAVNYFRPLAVIEDVNNSRENCITARANAAVEWYKYFMTGTLE